MVSAWLPMNTASPRMRMARPMGAPQSFERAGSRIDRDNGGKPPNARKAKGRAYATFLFKPGSILRLEAHEVVHQSIEAPALAGVDVDPADLLDHPLQALQLLEPEQPR